MEQNNSLQKKIGIILGSVVIVGVAIVTFVFERMSSPTTSAQTNSSGLSSSVNPVVATVPANSTSKNTTTSKTLSEDSSDSGSDEGGENSAGTASNTQTPVTSPTVSTPPPAVVPKQTASVYKNGTYSATGSYMSPGGEEQIKVILTLANDIITSASVTSMAYDRTSQRYQDKFISGYQQYVIGKNITSVKLTYVSGSSLTPIGFDNALAQIESQAKV